MPPQSQPKLFRAVRASDSNAAQAVYRARHSVRLPSNVPYVVDNLWEYLRPDGMPCRRNAVYASATPALALANASADGSKGSHTVFAVEIQGAASWAQLRVKDAREHADIGRLKKLAQEYTGEFASAPWDQRQLAAMLFMPAATRQDWNRLETLSPLAKRFIEAATAVSTYWSEIRSAPEAEEGELYFELGPTASYRLVPAVQDAASP